LLLAVAVLALIGSACSSTLTDAATVNYSQKGSAHEFHVSRDDLLSEVGKLVENKPFAKWLTANQFVVNKDLSADSKISAIWLSTLIRQQAIDAIFASRHLKVTSAQSAQAAKDAVQTFPTPDVYPAFDAKYRATLAERQARVEAVFASYADTSDAAGQKYFKAHQAQFSCPSGKDVSHILVATQAAAQQILDQLRQGASFATLAQQQSTDTTSGARGGALGCLAPNEFVTEFQAAADAAPLGTPVGPVKSKFGYHVILVTAAVASYEAARAQIQQALGQQGQLDAQAAIDALIKTFKVHLDSRFGTWGPATNGSGQTVYEVSPPKAPPVRDSREKTTTTTLPAAGPGNSSGTP
jgi:parvulin-like peptidyl-prolyl isomerase